MLLRSGIIVALFTLLSRIFGLFRELFIASTFGTGPNADAVNVAFKLPNLFRRIFGEGALSSIFVPMFSQKLTQSEEQAEKFASKVFFVLTISLIIFTAIMQYFMPELMYLVAPGFNMMPEKFELTVLLCRITMPYLLFISLVALVGGMLNSIGKFAAFAASPVIMSAIVIVGTMMLDKYIPNAHAIAWSVLLAGILQLLFMFISMYRNNLKLRSLHLSHKDQDIKKLLKLMVPATISSGIAQVNLFLSQSIASFIPGAVSILSYADRIYQVPLSIIGVTFGTILLPALAKLYKSGDIIKAKETQDEAIKLGLLLSTPCAVAIITLANPIIKMIYEHGAFDSEDTIRTAGAIAAYSIGLPAFILSKIFMPIFYANQDAKTPMKITTYSIIANISLNLILMYPLGHVGIALGTSISAWFNVYLFITYAKKNGYFELNREIIINFFKIGLSGLVASAIMWVMHACSLALWPEKGSFFEAIIVLSSIALGFSVYMIFIILSGTIKKETIIKLLKK